MLLTKLHIPPLRENLIQRTELYARLNEGLSRKLILISAPAGFGKTTLLCDWIKQQHIPTAWVSLDKSDNDMVAFVQYVVAGIRNIYEGFGEKALKLSKLPDEPNPEAIVALLLNDILEIEKDFLLVLDDYHLISNSKVAGLTNYLLEHSPQNLHVVIATRSDPSLSVAKLRVQQQLVELRSSDLSFSANEIASLFKKQHKVKLNEEDVYTLEAKTEGWIAGLQLAALSVQGREDISGFIQLLKGDNRYIMDYLIEEVLKAQPNEIKDFLLQTSILEQFSAPLCNAVLERTDSYELLEQLEKNNMFVVPLDNERCWYRYHHLFAHLLQQKLMFANGGEIENLHHKACLWYEKNNMPEMALKHALEVKDYERSIQILGRVVEELWEKGLHSAILKYGNLLPDEIIKCNANFSFYYAWTLIISGQIAKAEPFIAAAEEISSGIVSNKESSNEDVEYYNKLKGKIAVAYAYLNSNLECSEKIFDYCQVAMDKLSDEDPLWYAWAWFSYGVAFFSIGELIKSKEAFDKAYEYSKKSGNIYQISTIVIRMAENEQQLGNYKSGYEKCSELLAYLKNEGYLQITKAEWTFAALYFIMGVTEFIWAETDKALENLKIAYKLSKSGKDIYLKTFVLMSHSAILKEVGDADADVRAKELEELLKENQIPPFLTSFYIGWKIHFAILEEDLDKADSIVQEYDLKVNKEKNHSNEAAYSSYVRLLLLQNKLEEAAYLIDELLEMAVSGKRLERIIELKMSKALLHKLRGDKDMAISILMESMEVAQDENLISYYVYCSNKYEDLLEEVYSIQATSNTKIEKKFISDLKKAIQKHKQITTKNISPDISARELDTLKLIAENLSNQEIADKLFISLNTVKTHLKNIYLKLDVDNRTKAVKKAKDYGII